jgi:hypothetical protein
MRKYINQKKNLKATFPAMMKLQIFSKYMAYGRMNGIQRQLSATFEVAE